ncbi:MAG TPA: hypothetical protein O0X83_00410 [Methanocorpusculum sp.]|nr:hypothetical protein [Methanocorpusculum sp.]HJK27194.1 hypothetical protein [Methanocorpusculum sp.]
MPSDMPQKRSAAGSAEHEQHYSTDDDALAGRALGSTTPARGSGQTRYESLENRIKQMLQEDPILRQKLDELLRDE